MRKSLTTPVEYQKKVKNREFNKDMICQGLFSCNKSAKNCCEMAKKYRNKEQFANAYYERAAIHYRRKDILLSILEPKEIHVVFREREYFISDEYGKHMKTEEYDEYFLYYEIDTYGFHKPIFNPDDYPELKVIPIWDLKTKGYPYEKLLSAQFVKKLCDLVLSDDYNADDDLRPFLKKNKNF